MIEHKFRVNQIAMILDQPIRAVEIAALFVGGKGENDVAIRDIIFLLKTKQSGDHDGVTIFHVLSAASVEISVLLDELERVGSPVLAARLNHVEMSNEQDRFVRTRSVQAHDQVLLSIIRADDLNVSIGKAPIAEALRHGF